MTAFNILGLHHIAVATDDPDASTRFYIDVLGFRPIQRPNFNFRGAWLLGYGVQIHIIENRAAAGGRDAKIDTRVNHLAFAVEDHEPVRRRLDELGIADETLVVFTSDNGGLSHDRRSMGPPHTHNRPLSSGKGSHHEGGMRVPLLVRWPGVVDSNSVCETPVVIYDWFPTLCEVGNAPRSAEITVDGLSLVPLLKGNGASEAFDSASQGLEQAKEQARAYAPTASIEPLAPKPSSARLIDT